MKRQFTPSLLVVTALPLAISITLAAQDRFILETPNGIAFSEFKGYEAWQVMAPSQPDDAGGCGSSPAPGCIKAILGNPAMIRASTSGVPDNGKPVPDGAIMAKVEWRKATNTDPYAVTVPGPLSEVSFMVKDAKRFPETKGWGFATFRYDASAKTWKPFGAGPEFAKTCLGCHDAVKNRDYVFTKFAQR
jgi:Cytochrome P460